MSMNPEGYYPGKIVGAWVEQVRDDLVMCFQVEIERPDDSTTEVTAKHFATGKWGDIGQEVAKLLEVPWPDGLRKLDAAIGREVEIKIKHKDQYENAYIVTPAVAKPATPEQIDAGLAKLEAATSDDDTPF